jgi:hypothetical protein
MAVVGFLNEPVIKWSGKAVILREDLNYIANSGVQYITHAGLYTDLASVPSVLRTTTAVLGAGWQQTAAAGILHDGLYKTGRVSRHMADDLFREALVNSGLSKWKARVMWAGVRSGGWLAWRRHRNAEGGND